MERMRPLAFRVTLCALLAGGMLFVGGCREHMPHALTLGTGDVIETHAKPIEGGYYSNWDPYAATITLEPLEDVNPVNTQHVFVATVLDKEGKPLPNRRVEWMIAEGGVGMIVEVDESGWRASRGYKKTNTFAVSHTNNFKHVLTRGNDDPSDDVHLGVGQTWCVITSPTQGTTHVVAYAPGIYDWSKHKAFAKKHWFDVAWEFPQAATNPIGTPHVFETRVFQHSDGRPLPGYEVTYRITSGPAATLNPGGKQAATVQTDAEGIARVTLEQATPTEGVNELEVAIFRPEDKSADQPSVRIARGTTSKTWIGPRIGLTKAAPAAVRVGDPFDYALAVTNPSQVDATNVKLVDTLPEGIQFVSADPQAQVRGQTLSWDLGTLAAGTTSPARVTAKATRSGTFQNRADVTADHGLSDRATADTRATQPALSISRTGPAEVLLCDPIQYTVVVTNTGDAPANNVRIIDTLPEGLVYQGQHRTVTSQVESLAPGQSMKVVYEVAAEKPGSFDGVVDATADGGFKASANGTTVVRRPALALTTEGPKIRYAGSEATYAIRLVNNGDGEARDTVLVHALPTNARLVRADNGGKAEDGKLTWALGNVPPGGERTCTVVLQTTEIGELVTASSVTAACSKAADRFVTAVKGIPAILLECVDSPDPIQVGDATTYTIEVTNQGSAVGTGIVIRCDLPKEQQFVSAEGPTKHTAEGQSIAFAPLTSLAPQAVATYKVVAKAIEKGDVRFKVALTSDQMTSPAEETESTYQYAE